MPKTAEQVFTEAVWDAFLPGDQALWDNPELGSQERVHAITNRTSFFLGGEVQLKANITAFPVHAPVSVRVYRSFLPSRATASLESIRSNARFPVVELSFLEEWLPTLPHFKRTIALSDEYFSDERAIFLEREQGPALRTDLPERIGSLTDQLGMGTPLLVAVINDSLPPRVWPVFTSEYGGSFIKREANRIAARGLSRIDPPTIDQGRRSPTPRGRPLEHQRRAAQAAGARLHADR